MILFASLTGQTHSVAPQESDRGDLSLVPSTASNSDDGCTNIIYQADPADPCRVLSGSAKLCVSYSVLASLKGDESSLSLSLGSILVDWKPTTLTPPALPDTISNSYGPVTSHGPLALDAPSTMCFTGPTCYVEETPFEVTHVISALPLSVACPFTVQYSVKNKTGFHQMLLLEMREAEVSSATANGLLLSGCADGIITLGPYDEHMISFTVVATRPGLTSLPALLVSSDRYRSWVINGGPVGKSIFIHP
jgi:hypothetical protein